MEWMAGLEVLLYKWLMARLAVLFLCRVFFSPLRWLFF